LPVNTTTAGGQTGGTAAAAPGNTFDITWSGPGL
jgi:hypothetical protein